MLESKLGDGELGGTYYYNFLIYSKNNKTNA